MVEVRGVTTFLSSEYGRSVKYERVYLRAYDSVSAARKDIAEYIDWYNGERGHSSLDGKTPEEVWLYGLPSFDKVA
jgi:putative transposase